MLQVFFGNQRVTDNIQALSWSASDPGGFEIADITISSSFPYPDPGITVAIYDGMSTVWRGRVEEPGDDYSFKRASGRVGAVGVGALLRDGGMSMVFVDRDLSRWQGLSLTRRAALTTAWHPLNDAAQESDPSGGSPGLKLDISGIIDGSSGGRCEAWYDSGPDNTIKTIGYDYNRSSYEAIAVDGTASTYDTRAGVASNDGATGAIDVTPDLNADLGAPGGGDASTAKRWAYFIFGYNGARATSVDRWRVMTNISLLGNHGLALYDVDGVDPLLSGLIPDDIVRYVIAQIGSNICVPGVIDRPEFSGANPVDTTYLIPQLAYYEQVVYEQIIDDVAKLVGWHWGVWEPFDMFGTIPRLDFRRPPTDATCAVYQKDCQNIQLSKRASDMWASVKVYYNDAFGSRSYVTVRATRNELSTATRQTTIDVGTSTSNQATTFGTQFLQLSETSARAAGSVQLPTTVFRGGVRSASHLVRPGIDKLRIDGLQNSGSWTFVDNRRFDTFRIKRITCEYQGGNITTTAELDSGANLLEVLQARLSILNGVIG